MMVVPWAVRAVRADRPSSLPHDAAPHAGHKACMHLARLICLLISLCRASCQPVTIFHKMIMWSVPAY